MVVWHAGYIVALFIYFYIYLYLYSITVYSNSQFTVYNLRCDQYSDGACYICTATVQYTVGMILDNKNVKYVKVSCTGARAYKKIITYICMYV